MNHLYNGNTVFYQTDWDIIGLKVKLQNNDLSNTFKTNKQRW